MKLDTLRVSNSHYCELDCAYCPSTNTRSQNQLKSLPLGINHVTLACNTVYRDDLAQFLTEPANESSVEIHFLSLANPRLVDKIKQITEKNYSLIVVIDHLDSKKIQSLERWNQYVSEYRVIPSRLYPVDIYLNKLPYFIHNKLQWAFPPEQSLQDHVLSPDEVYWSLEQIQKSPLSSTKISNHMWQKTWEPHTENKSKKFMTIFVEQYSEFENLSIVTKPIIRPNSSQFSIDMARAESLYVGHFSQLNDSIIEEIQTLGYDLLYFSPPEYTEVTFLDPQLTATSKDLYLLENFIIRKDLWLEYINQTQQINDYTWNQFLDNYKDRILIKKIPTSDIPNYRQRNITAELKQHYYGNPSPELYSKLFLINSSSPFMRQSLFYFYHFIYTLLNFVPNQHKARLSNIARSTNKVTMSAAYNLNDELKDTSSTIKRGFLHTKYILHKLFWLSYNKVHTFYGEILKRIFYGTIIRKYFIGVLMQKYICGLILKKYTYGLILKKYICGLLLKKYLYSYFLLHFVYYALIKKILVGAILYNFLFGKVFCRFLYGTIWSPTYGFLQSLNDYPAYVEHLPFRQRLKVKTYLILRKFGWLALRTIGMK